MIDFIVSVFAGTLGSTGRSAWRRTYDAYKDAWRSTSNSTRESDDRLRSAFKAQSAPGAYTDPDGELLAPWLSAWRQQLPPRQARRAVRREVHG